MTPTPCISEPVSWLRLERFALGELAAASAREIADHVASCPACRASLARIETDDRVLPPLPATAVAPAIDAPPRRWWSWPKLAWSGGLLAAAAALLLIVVVGRDPAGRRGPEDVPPPGGTGPRIRVKGAGEVVLSVVRERDGGITAEAATFDAGDRFKVRVTCDTAVEVYTDTVVFQPGRHGSRIVDASFPLPVGKIACGNLVVLPGAFRITDAAPATVCVAVDAVRPPDRAAIARGGPGAPNLACLPLAPE